MSLFQPIPNASGADTTRPLADRMRPRTLDEYVGQEHLIGPGKPLRTQVDRDDTGSLIFWGPPGTGKTTLAKIIANMTKEEFIEFSAVLAGIAGALYVPQIGIINPSEFSPINSIEVVIWVAVGGRGTLYGAAAGALLVNYAKTYFTSSIPEAWNYALGALFVLVTLFLPRGIIGLFSGRVRKQAEPGRAPVAAAKPEASGK